MPEGGRFSCLRRTKSICNPKVALRIAIKCSPSQRSSIISTIEKTRSEPVLNSVNSCFSNVSRLGDYANG